MEKMIEIIFPRIIRSGGVEIARGDLRVSTSDLRHSNCIFFEDCCYFAAEEVHTDVFICLGCPFQRIKVVDKDVDKARRLYWNRRADRSMKAFTSEVMQIIENGKIISVDQKDSRIKTIRECIKVNLEKFLIADGDLRKIEGSGLIIDMVRAKNQKGEKAAIFRIQNKRLLSIPIDDGTSTDAQERDTSILATAIRSILRTKQEDCCSSKKSERFAFVLGGLLIPGLETPQDIAGKVCADLMSLCPDLDIDILSDKELAEELVRREQAQSDIVIDEASEDGDEAEPETAPETDEQIVSQDQGRDLPPKQDECLRELPSPKLDEVVQEIVQPGDEKASSFVIPSRFKIVPIEDESLLTDAWISSKAKYDDLSLASGNKRSNFVIFIGNSNDDIELSLTERHMDCLATEFSWLTGVELRVDIVVDNVFGEREMWKIYRNVTLEQLSKIMADSYQKTERQVSWRSLHPKTKKSKVAKERRSRKKSTPTFSPADPAIWEKLDSTISYFIQRFSGKKKGRQDFVLIINGARYDLQSIDRRTARCIDMASQEILGEKIQLLSVNHNGKLVPIATKEGGIVGREVNCYLYPKTKKPKAVKEPVSRKRSVPTFLSADPAIQERLNPVINYFTRRFSGKEKNKQDFTLVINGTGYELQNVDMRTARCIKMAVELKLESDVRLFSINKIGKLAAIKVSGYSVRREVEKYLHPEEKKLKIVKGRVDRKKFVSTFLPADPTVQEQLSPIIFYFTQNTFGKESGKRDFVLVINCARYDLKDTNRKVARCIKLAVEAKLATDIKLFSVNKTSKLVSIEAKGNGVQREVERYLHPKPRKSKEKKQGRLKTEFIIVSGGVRSSYFSLSEMTKVLRAVCKAREISQVIVAIKPMAKPVI